jgi:hypothetical protein
MIGAGVPMPRDDLQALPGSCRPAAVEVEVVDLLPRDREVRAGVDEQDSGCVDDHPARLARSLADLDRAGPTCNPPRGERSREPSASRWTSTGIQ